MEIRRSKLSRISQWKGESFTKEDYYEVDSCKWLGMADQKEEERIEISLETSRLPESATEGLPVVSTGLAKMDAQSFEEVTDKLKERGLDVVDHRIGRFL